MPNNGTITINNVEYTRLTTADGNISKIQDANGNVIWEDCIDYANEWFTIRRWTNEYDISVKIQKEASDSGTVRTWEYETSFDGSTWVSRTITSGNTTYIPLYDNNVQHEFIYIRSRYAPTDTDIDSEVHIGCVKTSNHSQLAYFVACGKLSSLHYGTVQPPASPAYIDVASPARAFYYLFVNSSIVDAHNLIFPYQGGSNETYTGMFRQCNYLVTAPNLPATSLAEYMYSQMFYECSSLEIGPVIFATTVNSTDLPPFYQMFRNCVKLKWLECRLSGNTAADLYYATGYWLYNAGTSVTGTKKIRVYSTEPWDSATGSLPGWPKAIPDGWTKEYIQ